MTELLSEASPRLKARFAGLFQLLEGLASSFGQVYLLGMFVVTSDPAATAANILANDWMTYLFPSLARQIFALIATASGLGEIPLLLWLLVKGVNAERWKEQARTRQAPSD